MSQDTIRNWDQTSMQHRSWLSVAPTTQVDEHTGNSPSASHFSKLPNSCCTRDQGSKNNWQLSVGSFHRDSSSASSAIAMLDGSRASSDAILTVDQLTLATNHRRTSGNSTVTETAALSSSRLARATQQMDLNELHHLRDWLVKSSIDGSSLAETIRSYARSTNNSLSDRPTMGPLGVSQLGPIQNNHDRGVSNAPSFFNVSSTNLGPSVSVNFGRYTSRMSETSARPTVLPATGQLPRESVAYLIDAVRGSTLGGDDKCRFLFDLFDVDKKGFLTKDGATTFIDALFVANGLQVYGDLQVRGIVDKLFHKSTANPTQMTCREFGRAFTGVLESSDHTPPILQEANDDDQPPLLSSQIHVQCGARWRPLWVSRLAKWHLRLKRRYRKHSAEIFYLAVYVVVMIAALVIKASYISFDPAVGNSARIAKGFAQIVMVNTLFLLFPMCRNFVAFLRQFAAISSRVPVDQHIEFHKICGVVMLLASLGHTVAWLFIVYYLRTVSDEIWQQSRYAHLDFVRDESLLELCGRLPIWTGVVMVLIAVIAAPMTHPKIRRGNFNAFWVTHMLFVPFLVLILVHGLAMWVQPPQAYYWVLPPCLLYLIEKRFRVSNVFGGRTSILRVRFSHDTAAIYMVKPDDFHYQPGMYLFLNVPSVSRFEWHPFTISSAPEDDCLSVHVRNAGDWTSALHAALQKIETDLTRQDADMTTMTTRHDLESAVSHGGVGTPPRSLEDSPYPTVFIDGPVGAPSQDYFRYQSVVFVGAGIGVTPFASILQSIVHQWQAYQCDDCQKVKLPPSFRLQQIYFYWITRDQEALTWFAETMNQLSAMDLDGRLEIHNYYSPLKRESVIAPLHALQKLIHGTDGHDIISGLATKQVTHFGRPDWKGELNKISQQQAWSSNANKTHNKKKKVGVFFCGPKSMGNQIHDVCAAFNQDPSRGNPNVVYDFHSENF